MSSSTKLLATIAKIDNNNFSLETDNMISIDTSNNRIGINTLDPSYSIDILGNRDISGILRCDTIICSNFISDSITQEISQKLDSITSGSQITDNVNQLIKSNNDACFNIIDISSTIILSKSKNLTLEYFNNLDISLSNLLTSNQDASFGNVEIIDLSCETMVCNDISTTTFKLIDLYMATKQLYLDLSGQPGLVDNSMLPVYDIFR